MNRIRRLITIAVTFSLPLTALTFPAELYSQQGPAHPSPLYVATFIDLLPPGLEAGTAVIKQYVTNTRKEPGIISCEAVAQIAGRANHLMLWEVWKNEAAFEKHQAIAHTLDFRAKIAPLIGAPFDQREHFLVE